MNKKNELLQIIFRQGFLPLFYTGEEEVSVQVLRVLYKAGARIIEYTNRGENALRNFKRIKKVCETELKEMHIGAGTIKDKRSAKQFIDAGADFIISPGMINEVANIADKNNLLWIPGCMTATEIIHAENLGAKLIKIFPGNLLGPSYINSLKDIFPDLFFMPTGGVEFDKENIKAWFSAGVYAIGMGSKFISKELLEKKDYATIEERTIQLAVMIKSIK